MFAEVKKALKSIEKSSFWAISPSRKGIMTLHVLLVYFSLRYLSESNLLNIITKNTLKTSVKIMIVHMKPFFRSKYNSLLFIIETVLKMDDKVRSKKNASFHV